MRSLFIRYGAFLLAGLIVLSMFPLDTEAQRRRRRRVRTVPRPVVTNPEIAPPGSEGTGPDGEKIISTADETPADPTAETSDAKKKKPTTNSDMQQTINALSNQVNRLNDKLSKMEENDRSLIDIERLTRAEQRAENLRMQQVDVESKLADLQSRLEQAEYAMKPENIERSNAGFGTLRPEEARETRRRQLEGERSRLQAQIRILETSRVRLEQAVATADAEVELLRRRMEQQREREATGAVQTEPRPARPE
jgi:DNA repair exonuclease SbcCD ATPase subunit